MRNDSKSLDDLKVPKNKELTKERLINAVGELLIDEGYSSLKINKIAKKAGVDKKLIYRYFGNVESLIQAYLRKKDFWMDRVPDIEEQAEAIRSDSGKILAGEILQNQLKYFYDNTEMQRIILWEISEKNALLKGMAETRENLGSELFKVTDNHFKGSSVNLRAIEALLVSGIYYLVLHAKTNGSTFCEIDINDPNGREEINIAARQIIDWAYEKANL